MALVEAERLVMERGWIAVPLSRAFYASAGRDTRPLTLLHPSFLEAQGAAQVPPPNFFVFVDYQSPGDEDRVPLVFDDVATQITTSEVLPVRIGAHPARLLRCRLESEILGNRDFAVLRIRAKNEQLLSVAESEQWSPEIFIAVNDGCTGFGGNHRCENSFNPDWSLPIRLNPRFWVTDHFADPALNDQDPADGEVITATAGSYAVALTQVAFLSVLWRTQKFGHQRLRGGARIFSIDRGLAASGQIEEPAQ